mmetsp:Transcript_1253/g.3429  ORF Transcript_1253/g.3429 Transcript_1253/m.3429 type:complete len:318 (+) Transcript_1253:219-1172(+)
MSLDLALMKLRRYCSSRRLSILSSETCNSLKQAAPKRADTIIGTTALTPRLPQRYRSCSASSARTIMGMSLQNRRIAAAFLSASVLGAVAMTTNSASRTLKFSSTSFLVQSAKNTGKPLARKGDAIAGLSSKTTYRLTLLSAVSSSMKARATAFQPHTTTNCPERSRSEMTAEAITSLPSKFSCPRAFRRPSASFSPPIAKAGVKAIDNTVVDTSKEQVRGASMPSLSARPNSTKANSPPGASIADAWTDEAYDNPAVEKIMMITAAFTTSKPSKSGTMVVHSESTKLRSSEKPTFTKKRPSKMPRNGAMSASTWYR